MRPHNARGEHARCVRIVEVGVIPNRLLPQVVKRANTRREQDGRMLLPARVTPRTLRRTWAMLALTAGRDVRWGDGADGAHRRA